nr:hypothetical protein [Enterovibrio nigricans]
MDELIAQSLRNFQSDCLSFCEHHYPTIHNRGMKDSHMGKALSRRIVHSFDNLNIDTQFSQLEETSSYKQPIYCIETDSHQVFVLAHRMISASSACRNGLVRDIKQVLGEVSIDKTKDARLIIVADTGLIVQVPVNQFLAGGLVTNPFISTNTFHKV